MLELTRPLICLDVETTGIDPKTDRIIQLGVVRLDPDGSEKEWVTLINPERQIPAEASGVHKITNEMVVGAPTFAQLARPLAPRLSNCDFAGYNCKGFDLPFLDNEFLRAGVAWSYTDAAIVDAFKLYTQMYPRNLAAFVKHMLGEDISAEAHDALVDTRWTLRALLAFVKQHPQLPRTVRGLHEAAFPVNPNRVDKEGRLEWRAADGAACFTFGKYRGKSLEEVAKLDGGYLRWIVDISDMSQEIKSLCARARSGDFAKRG